MYTDIYRRIGVSELLGRLPLSFLGDNIVIVRLSFFIVRIDLSALDPVSSLFFHDKFLC